MAKQGDERSYEEGGDPDAPTIALGRLGRVGASYDNDVDPNDETVRARPRKSDETVRLGRGKRVQGGMEDAGVLPAGWLVVVEGPGVGHVATIQTGTNVLGRGPTSHIVLDLGDDQIAREDHVRLVYNRLARTFHVAPGRGPETWLKGSLVMQAERLERGDLVTVGATVLRFVPFCDDSFDWTSENPG